MEPYEVFEHTADVGLRIRGRDLAELLRHAAQGLFHLITEPDAAAGTPLTARFEIRAADAGELLVAWLRELIFSFDVRRAVWTEFRFESVSERELRAEAKGYAFDPDLHEQRHEVKAVTYHGFRIARTDAGWTAEVIFDL